MARKRRLPASRPPDLPGRPPINKVLVLAAVAGLVGLVATVFADVRHYGFINLDDPGYVRDNPYVLGGFSRTNLAWAWTTGHAANWHPLTWMSHMLDAELFGSWAGGHHLTSVVLHGVNTILVFVLLWRTTGGASRALFVAALFGIHPMHVESVAWISERKDVLSTFFWLLTMFAYVAWVRRKGWLRYVTVCLLLALGLTAKPMLVTLPLVLVLFDIWPLGRWASERRRLRELVPLIREKLPLFLLAIASSVVTFVVQRQGGAVTGLGLLPLETRIENALVAYARYVGKLFWPTNMALFYPYSETLPYGWIAGSAVGLIVLSIVAWRLLTRQPAVAVGWFWFVITLVPVIGIVQVGTQAIADRYTYVPYIGLLIAVAWGVDHVLSRRAGSLRRPVAATAGILIAIACAIQARAQVRVWESNWTVWSHALEVTEGNYLAHNEVGMAHGKAGRFDEALAHFEASSRSNPEYVEVRNNLGLEYVRRGRVEDAIAQYTLALRLRPEFVDARNNLGVALMARGRTEEAMAQFREVLRVKPDSVDAHNNLGFLLAANDDVRGAIVHFEEAIRLKPDDEAARLFLSLALAAAGQLDAALVQAREALRLNPGSAGAKDAIARLEAQIARRRPGSGK